MIAPGKLPVPGSGSVEICMLSIARKLAQHHKVTIVSRRSPKLNRVSSFGNLQIVRVAAGSTYISSVLQYIRGKRYDVIQVDNRPHHMAKVKQAFPHIPVTLFLHSLTFVPKTAKVAASLKKADLIIANSHSVQHHLCRRFPSQKRKIKTVYLGVETSRFKPISSNERKLRRKQYGIDQSFVIVFAGRMVPRKGISILIKATNIARYKVRDAKLLLVGGGKKAYMRKLKSQTKRLKVPTQFLGEVPHTHIHRLYQMADCFVCPSQRHEAFGLVNVEAMSTGVPVIASNIGGIKEIIRHGSTGYLVRHYRSPKSFSYYILKIASNKKKAKNMANKGRKTATSRFNWKRTARELAKIYTQTLNN